MGYLITVSRRQRVVLATLAVLAATASGCAVREEPGATSTDAAQVVPQDLRVERRTWGGLCPEGPCRSELVVEATGHWTLRTESGTQDGTYPDADLAELARAVEQTSLDAAGGEPTCAADFDGTSVEYVWRSGGTSRSASSCEQRIHADDPLASKMDELAGRADE